MKRIGTMVPRERMKLADCSGHWALVTGASSGIGAEFCRQLAMSRVNLVMVARRGDLLAKFAKGLSHEYSIKTLVVPVDLAETGSADKVRKATRDAGIAVRLLVNNAAYGPWGSFERTSAHQYERIMQLVASTPIALCRLYLNDLESFRNSAIVNLSSPAALQPVPYKAVYSAAKTCLHNFSLALYGEWGAKGIMVQTLLPGPTATALDKIGDAYGSQLGEARQSPFEVVRLSLDRLGHDEPVVTTNKGTYKQRVFAGVAPTKFVVRQVKKMFQPPPGR